MTALTSSTSVKYNACHEHNDALPEKSLHDDDDGGETAKIITYGAGIRHEHDARCHHKPADNLAQTSAQSMTHSMSRRGGDGALAKIKVSYAKIAAEKEAAEEVQEGGGSRLMAVRPALVHGLWMPPRSSSDDSPYRHGLK